MTAYDNVIRPAGKATTMDTPSGGHPRPRGGRGRFVKTVATAQRDAEAAALRSQGNTYDAIALALGFANRTAARRSVERGLTAIVTEPATELRHLELIRLDALWMQAMKVLTTEHVTVSNGKVVTIDGEPVPDDAPVLSAIDRLLKIMERRAKLTGLDAPAKVEVLTLEAIDAEIRKLSDELGRPETGAATAVEGTPAAES